MSNTRRPVNRVTPGRRPVKVAGRSKPVVDKVPTKQRSTTRRSSVSARLRDIRPPRPRWRAGGRRAAVVLGVGAVLLAGFAVLAALRPGARPGNQAFVDTAATQEVKAAAVHVLTTVYGYDSANMAGYKNAVHTVLTGQMAAEFDRTADVTIAGIEQTRTKTDVSADPVGVTMLNGNRAELLIDVNISSTKGGTAGDSVAGPIVLRLTRINGHWLAANIVSTSAISQ